MILHHLKKTCDASPSQWEAINEHGQHVYIRFCFDELTVYCPFNPNNTDPDDAVSMPSHYEAYFKTQILKMEHVRGEEYAGYMDDEEMLRLTGYLLANEQANQFVHWVPPASLVHYDGYHQRATVVSVVHAEQRILNLSIPQGAQGRGWPVGTCQIVDNVPYSPDGEPNTWHEVTIREMPGGDYELETCECGQFTTRQTYAAYRAQHGDERA